MLLPTLPPRIETERLVLRAWEIEDAAPLHAALVESVEHLSPWIPWATDEAPTLTATHSLLSGWLEQRAARENFIYAVFHRLEEQLLGGVGLYGRVGPEGLEIGYWLRASEAGCGFATEASRAVTDLAFTCSSVLRMEIHTDPANLASRRIPEKLGFTRVGANEVGSNRDAEDGGSAVYILTRAEDSRGRHVPQNVR